MLFVSRKSSEIKKVKLRLESGDKAKLCPLAPAFLASVLRGGAGMWCVTVLYCMLHELWVHGYEGMIQRKNDVFTLTVNSSCSDVTFNVFVEFFLTFVTVK